MSILITGDISEDMKEAIYRFVTRNDYVDHLNAFRDSGSQDVHVLKEIRTSSEPVVPGSRPVKQHDPDASPCYVTLVDTQGHEHDVNDCKADVGFKHAFGILYHDADGGGLWLLTAPQDSGGLASAETVADYEVIRLHGLSQTGEEDLGEMPDEDEFSEGEFYYSDEERPVIVACAWRSIYGTFEGGFSSPDKVAEDERIKTEVRAAVARVAQDPTPSL